MWPERSWSRFGATVVVVTRAKAAGPADEFLSENPQRLYSPRCPLCPITEQSHSPSAHRRNPPFPPHYPRNPARSARSSKVTHKPPNTDPPP